MTQDTAIRVEDLSKTYLIGHNVARGQETLRDALTRNVRNFARTTVSMARGRQILGGDEIEEFQALSGVSFEIARGEVVGIIGRNGAGKSTLLKVLSRITEPTRGRITIDGRVASLLEVGTGFHPELTGRENVFLNGAILGMSRAEIRAKFDEIVEFAGIEKFLDTPVKRYSSGMYVRLAFSVAAHLEPEILIVDEVLAVGDVEFQRKCLGKMQNVASEGRTVLFVSHNLQAVERLCSRGLVLQQGQVIFDGPAQEACALFEEGVKAWNPGQSFEAYPRRGDGRARITDLAVLNGSGEPVGGLPSGEDIVIRVSYHASTAVPTPSFGLSLFTLTGVRVFHTVSTDGGLEIGRLDGRGTMDLRIPSLPLAPGHYLFDIAITDNWGEYCDHIAGISLVDIAPHEGFPKTRQYDQKSGVIFAPVQWTHVSQADESQ